MNWLLPLAEQAYREKTFWMPMQASEQAPDIDWLYYFIYWLCVLFFVGICVSMVWFAWAYRRQEGARADHSLHHNLTLELAWSVPPTILVVFMFWWGFVGFVELHTPPADAYKIEVQAKKWDWKFIYPTGAQVAGVDPANPDEFNVGLHCVGSQPGEAGRPVHVVLAAEDVLHAFFVSDFRVKADAVPGRFTDVWFTPRHMGTKDASGKLVPERHTLFCAEYCGTKHSLMRSQVIVHPDQASFDEWMTAMINPYINPTTKKPRTPEEVGEYFYKRECASCHTTSEIKAIGPGFGLLSRRLKGGESREVIENGATKSVQVTEDYIRHSILDPNAQIVSEIPAGGMTATIAKSLTPKDIDMIIAYIKSLADKPR